MAGLGRRTHYRKHLTDSVLYDLPEPKQYERIAKVVATRGGNQFDIILAGTGTTENSNISGLAILPTKFHKLVWVKRNDYVIVQTGINNEQDDDDDNNEDDEDIDNGKDKQNQERSIAEAKTTNDANETGIRFIISHILYKDQVKHLISKGFWPKNDPEFSENHSSAPTADESDEKDDKKEEGDGIVYNTEYGDYDDNTGIYYTEYDNENDDDLFVNTNRIARLEIQDSDDEEGESTDEED